MTSKQGNQRTEDGKNESVNKGPGKQEAEKKEDGKKKDWFSLVTGLAAFLFLLCLLGIAAAGVCCLFAPDLSDFDPNPEDFYARILDENGEELDTSGMHSTARKSVPLDEISETAQAVFLRTLDPDFYEEKGPEEATSITRRLLNCTVYYNRKNISTGLKGKIHWIQETYLTLVLEKEHTKDWILEKYLNNLDFGSGTRGIREAAIYYFQELPEKLTEEQAKALLAYAENAGESEAAPFSISDWYQQALLDEVVSDLMENCGYTSSEAWNSIYNAGLTIYSTENPQLQKICSENAEKSAYVRNQEQISIVITDNETGAVTAIIGGRKIRKKQTADSGENDMQDNGFGEHGEELDADVISGGAAGGQEQTVDTEQQQNRAVELRRKPGELLSVLGQYAAGLESGTYTLATVINDAACTDQEGQSIDSQAASHAGRITLHEAINTGNRTASYKVYRNIGESAVREMLAAFGLGSLSGESDAALALGETEGGLTNLELNAAYGTIARGGSYIAPYFYTKVTDSDGKEILKQQTQKTQAIQKTTAELLTIAMENVFSGSAAYERVNSAQVAGISCSTEDKSDAWFAGFSPYYTCTIWGGNEDGSPQEDCSYVSQLWREIMDEAHSGISGADDQELVDTDHLVKVEICTKCGKCAVSGLCDRSMQGNKTEDEYFIRGTSPAKECDCHEKVSICTVSNKRATSHCPSSSVITGVYLTRATLGTDDAKYCVDQLSTEECDLHTGLFGNKD